MGQKVGYAKFKDILLSMVRGVRHALVSGRGGWRAKGRAKKWEDRPARACLKQDHVEQTSAKKHLIRIFS